jgi:hypothetical protein
LYDLLIFINFLVLSNLQLSGSVVAPNNIFPLLLNYSRMQTTFKDRIFEQRITTSLNFVDPEDNTFKVRNLFCRNLSDVVLQNMEAVHVLQKTAKTTTKENPILIIPGSDKSFMLNLIQTAISENCGMTNGFFKRDMGIPCKTQWYIFCVTNERVFAAQKLRVVIVKEGLLQKINEGKYAHVDLPKFEHQYGYHRWYTILKMAKAYQEQRDSIQCHGDADLMRVEIVVPMYATNRIQPDHFKYYDDND